jgi:hypothetical protein
MIIKLNEGKGRDKASSYTLKYQERGQEIVDIADNN